MSAHPLGLQAPMVPVEHPVRPGDTFSACPVCPSWFLTLDERQEDSGPQLYAYAWHTASCPFLPPPGDEG